ncbi:MAG: spore coat protein GerQ [Beduini sp.]|uniref:spore coat protein GerQ n=1 Tax=Beduini sp. TaxID=1922300 RepID=UPI0039A2950F
MDYQKTYTYPSTLNQTTQGASTTTPYTPQQTMPQYAPNQPYPTPPAQTPLQPVPPQILPQPVPPINFPEQSYIENILRLNKGKVGTFYFTYTDSNEWRDRVYKGVIEAAGRDHLIISDPKTGKRYLFQMIYFVWAEFDEEIQYEYPYR